MDLKEYAIEIFKDEHNDFDLFPEWFEENLSFILKNYKRGGEIVTYLANAFSLSMLPKSSETTINVRRITPDMAKTLLEAGFISCVGHEDTAKIIAGQIGRTVPTARTNITLMPGDLLVVAQYTGPRLEPGTTVLPQDAKIEYFLVQII